MDFYNVKFTCMNDAMFKMIFKDKDNLAFYLNKITKHDFKASEISEISNEIKTSINNKGILYDVSVSIDNRIYVDFEAQNDIRKPDSFKRRMVHYSSALYSRLFDRGSTYDEDHKSIVIFLVNDKNENGRDYEIIQFQNQYNDLYDMQYIYKINIPKFINNFKPKTEDDKLLLEGLKLLISEECEEFTKSNNQDIRRVAEQIMSLNNDEKARLAMEMQAIRELHDRLEREAEIKEAKEKARTEGLAEGKAEGLAEGLAQGKVEGLTQGKAEALDNNIKTMHKNGADIEMIAKLLNMDINKVKEILNK